MIFEFKLIKDNIEVIFTKIVEFRNTDLSKILLRIIYQILKIVVSMV